VAPALWWNLLSPAGEWAGFDARWVAREAARHRRAWAARVPLVRGLRRRIVTAMTRGAWADLRARALRRRGSGMDRADETA